MKLKYTFTPNYPANLLEETQIAAQMEGITSHETQLKVISVVDNVKEEMDRIEGENAPQEETVVDRVMFGNTGYLENDPDSKNGVGGVTEVQGKMLNGAQTQSLLAIMSQFVGGKITEGQAVKLIKTAIGISKEEAKAILKGEMNEQ